MVTSKVKHKAVYRSHVTAAVAPRVISSVSPLSTVVNQTQIGRVGLTQRSLNGQLPLTQTLVYLLVLRWCCSRDVVCDVEVYGSSRGWAFEGVYVRGFRVFSSPADIYPVLQAHAGALYGRPFYASTSASGIRFTIAWVGFHAVAIYNVNHRKVE